MLADVTRLDLRLRRRSAIWYAAGMALYALVIVVLYPSFRHQTSLNSLSGSTAAALFGITGPLTSPGGWLNANIYGNFFPLIMLLLTIGYGAAALAGQDEDGTLALVTALPIRRRAIVLQKAGAMAAQALLLAVTVAICVVIGRSFQLTISPASTIAVSAALLLMGLDFGLLTMAVGAITAGGEQPSASARAWPPPHTWSAHWHRRSPPSGPVGTSRSSTGRPATTRSATASAWPTSRS